MKWLWVLLLIPILYVAFLFADTSVYMRTIDGKVIEENSDSIKIQTKEGKEESIPKLGLKLGQNVNVDIFKTRFTGKLLYKYSNTVNIEISTNDE